LITRHLLHIFFTEGLTFIFILINNFKNKRIENYLFKELFIFVYIFERITSRISRLVSTVTPTNIKSDVVPKPRKLEICKTVSIIFGKAAIIASKIAPIKVVRFKI